MDLPTNNWLERRKYLRILKSFSVFFYSKDLLNAKKDQTVTKDISKGGLRFIASTPMKEGLELIFEISNPYTAPNKLIIEGSVVASKEINPGLLYEIRVKFNSINAQAMQVLDILEKKSKGS